MFDYDKLVGSIYDCAANPELWISTLEQIRDHANGAYALVGYIDISPTFRGLPPITFRRNSAWSEEWLQILEAQIAKTRSIENFAHGAVDTAWTTMGEEEFEKSEFYQNWVAPQKLRDTLNVCYLDRHKTNGVLAVPSYATRELYGTQDSDFIERVSPHVRRSIMIGSLIDQTKMELALYRQVLDQLSVAVFVVGLGRRIVFTNASGDAMLSDGNHVRSVAGAITAQRIIGAPSALDDAIDRAAAGDTAIGISGIGVPLVGANGERSAAYVLPIAGKDIRGDLGKGHCAVFISQRGEQQPMAIEILRTVFDLSPTEARVATLIAKGEGPVMIAESLGITVNTVRSHLARAFSKTGAGDQTALGALVNKLMPPIAEK
jgi:DNA-binding CsgD family transcriptional regulator